MGVGGSRAAALSERGVLALRANRPFEALRLFDDAIAAAPRFAVAHFNRGVALKLLGRPLDEIAAYDQALELQPGFPEALNGRGVALHGLNRFEETLTSYDRALAARPAYLDAQINRSIALKEMRRLDEALAAAERALALAPDHPEAHWNAAMCRLMMGDYRRGFAEYEWRWRRPPLNRGHGGFAQPQWQGEDIAGRTLLLHAEQGLGDTIQFCRYAPLVAARGARVVLEVQPALKPLLAGLEGVSQLVARGGALPSFDLHCPLMSLPHACATTLDTVPARVPYLAAAPDRVASWRTRLAATPSPRIGFVWAGNRNHRNDRNRSIPLARLAPLFESGATWISLQQDVRPDDRAILEARANVVSDAIDGIGDFAETAALVAALDAVVTVDTSIAHLAGALAKPAHILLPYVGLDWRWLVGRDDSPWYPTARLYRQSAPDGWDGAIADVLAALT
jgi:hypothetical protein